MFSRVVNALVLLQALVFIALAVNADQAGKLDKLPDIAKYALYACIPILVYIVNDLLPDWLSLLISAAVVFLYAGYKIGAGKKS